MFNDTNIEIILFIIGGISLLAVIGLGVKWLKERRKVK